MVLDQGGAVLNNPVFLSITFASDTMAAQLDTFTSRFAVSNEWTDMTQEYGVGRATALTPAHLPESAPATITDTQIQSWLAAKINSASRPLGNYSNQEIFIIYYPTSTKITASGLTSCTDFNGYHSSFTNNGNPVYYAVIARCSGATVNDETEVASHEVQEIAVDPDYYNSAYYGLSGDFAVWDTVSYGSETSDLCERYNTSYLVPADIGFSIQRSWSNAAAAAGQNPCVGGASSVYYNASPVLSDTVSYVDTSSNQTRSTRGIYLSTVGQSKTIELNLFSTVTTSAWQLSAFEDGGSGSDLSFSFDKTAGVNGDKVNLTVTLNSKNGTHGEVFWIKSTLNGVSYYWPVIVGN